MLFSTDFVQEKTESILYSLFKTSNEIPKSIHRTPKLRKLYGIVVQWKLDESSFFFHKRCPPRGSPSCPSYEVAIFCACSSCEFFATLLTPRHEFFFSRAIHVVNKPRKQAPSRAPIRNNEWTKGRNPDFDPLC